MVSLRPVASDALPVGALLSGRPTPRPVSSAPRPTPPQPLQRAPAERRPDTSVTGTIGANLDVRV
ncbi:MAG TPA: hypothetical protein VG370_18250 [Chloroflexota bacterium]|jgi:hypothetical protein|nr:hypothetical protein [Chloroflexota bacterium]